MTTNDSAKVENETEQCSSGTEYATDVEIEHRDDGYVSVKTHEDSAMGRRILLLKPEELESLRRSLQPATDRSGVQ